MAAYLVVAGTVAVALRLLAEAAPAEAHRLPVLAFRAVRGAAPEDTRGDSGGIPREGGDDLTTTDGAVRSVPDMGMRDAHRHRHFTLHRAFDAVREAAAEIMTPELEAEIEHLLRSLVTANHRLALLAEPNWPCWHGCGPNYLTEAEMAMCRLAAKAEECCCGPRRACGRCPGCCGGEEHCCAIKREG